jgi:ABC-type transport system involved in cytochrome c biogenesis permease subunit
VHLLEKAPNLLESKLDISIVSCVIAHLYTKVNNVLLDLTGRFLAIKLLNLQKMQLYSYEELNYVIKLIEVTLFVLGVFLIVYWSSPRLRFYIALIFVCSLLSGVECFD